eukprot:CAMPEP_0117603146 /NCGR_PEP_ID=MMETSP0784-20121206/77973_1 /TAXON_ID=39447 /ORGANISM="" /LENGTH=40 /DNA_ID= /DNA_START= /DNA_END= /DNA_ORIENTATION=
MTTRVASCPHLAQGVYDTSLAEFGNGMLAQVGAMYSCRQD